MNVNRNANLSSLHTHTLFCDGKDDMETMCAAAYAKGLSAIGFSAHGPVREKTGLATAWHLPDERLNQYIDEALAARRRWEGKIAVYLGLELDYIKGLRSALDEDICSLPLDYIIGSVHYLVPSRGAPFTVDGPPEEMEQGVNDGFGGDYEAAMHAYWDALAEMIALGGFEILGHADLVKKNNRDNSRFDMRGDSCLGRCGEIARAAGLAGIAVEVNTGGLNRKKTPDTYPSVPFLRMFREQGVSATVTADAHCADDLDGNYDAALRALVEAGYGEHVLVTRRKEGRVLWRRQVM
jgi:histidinol-phosphatase (PHP family)